MLRDPSASVQDSVLFSYDDVFGLSAGAAGANLRALRERDWTYAVYFGIDGSRHRIRALRSLNRSAPDEEMLHGSPPADVRSNGRGCTSADAEACRGRQPCR